MEDVHVRVPKDLKKEVEIKMLRDTDESNMSLLTRCLLKSYVNNEVNPEKYKEDCKA